VHAAAARRWSDVEKVLRQDAALAAGATGQNRVALQSEDAPAAVQFPLVSAPWGHHVSIIPCISHSAESGLARNVTPRPRRSVPESKHREKSMNPGTTQGDPMIGKKPHTTGWLVGAAVCSLLAVLPAMFVYSEWQDVNEFTLMVTMIPALIALLSGGLALLFWTVWIYQLVRARKFEKHQQVLEQIRHDLRGR
jgi:hypothetical protein